jgi:ComF family protein
MFAVAEPLATVLVDGWPPWEQPVDLLIPIPLHPERERERGYNQSALLVRHLSRQLGLPSDEDALWRTRHTPPQVGLTVEQRRLNVRGAFAANGAGVAGRHVLLVDDVFTSGATLASAAGALLAREAQSVSGYCLARPIE